MFSGIIEKTVKVLDIKTSGTNKIFTFENPYGLDVYIDESISHNGVCLTVIEFDSKTYKVEAIKETLDVSNLNSLVNGDLVNLERCVQASTRLDGHMVQGHVDTIAKVISVEDINGSWEIELEFPEQHSNLVIHKGSICLNGISLTLMRVVENKIKVAIIPYTYEHTNIKNWVKGSNINIEFDMIGKYVMSYMEKISASSKN